MSIQLTLDEWLLLTAMGRPDTSSTLGELLDAVAPVPSASKRRGAALNRQAALCVVFDRLRDRGLVLDDAARSGKWSHRYRLSRTGVLALTESARPW